MDLFASWKTRHLGLLTFAESTKHVGLYQSFGFWPRYLIVAMSAPVVAPELAVPYARFSEVAPRDRDGVTSQIREPTFSVFDGLDVTREVEAVLEQRLGETLLIHDESGLQAVAVCHVGPGTEAGSGMCYVKFGAARPGHKAARSFARLVDACQDLAVSTGASVISAGVNLGRERAYAVLRQKGFRHEHQGLAMHHPNEPSYDRPSCYVIDDWR